MYCSACGHVVSTFNELAGSLFKKTLSSDKKAKVAAKVLADVCSKSGIDSISGGAGERKFLNFMKMQQEGSMNFDNLNMGSNISDQFKQFCNHLVANHGSDLENAYAVAARLYDVDLKKLLCKTLSGACVKLESGADL